MSTQQLTQSVLDSLEQTPDPRLKQILSSLVQHLHGFAREVQLSDAEWLAGIEFLTAAGQKCDAQRQEFILLSDLLGLSMLLVGQNQSGAPACTEATVLGPFHVAGAPEFEFGADIANGAPGAPCVVQGQVRDAQGVAIAGARLEVWQADAQGLYDVQRPGYAQAPQAQARGVLHSNAQGAYRFKTVVAEPYPVPVDGPGGVLLRATRRHPWRPAHLHFKISAPGFQTLVTHVFRAGDPYIDSDVVFGVKPSLVADWRDQGDGTRCLEFDFVLCALAL